MANICIIKDKKFRERAQAFNISTDTLEHITYKYYEEKKSNDQNPSDTYIKAQLGEFSYVEENPKIAELAKSIWDSKYSKPLSFDSEEQREKAKNAAEAIFPPQVILLYTDNQDKKVLTIRKPVAKLDIKYRKDFPDWHNYNDYLLVMGDAIPQNERQVEQKKTGPQPFTFNDGVTVTAPFKPNEQQIEALNAISDFINSDEVSMTLSGYAGTGKTSLMELIAAKMKKQHRKIVFTASTNKAAAVLKSRVKKAGFTAQTLNKVFGIQVEVDSSKPYDASNLVTLLKEADVSSGTVVVIDEASMINEENYSILNKIAKDNNLKIIYTGDKGQLAPVKETKISKVFRDKNRKVVTLTKVERTNDNAILKEATALRNGQPLSGESSFNSEGKGVAYIKPANKEGKRAIVKAFAPMLRKKPDFFRILAFTNKAVADYNTAVRNALGYHNSTPRVGEPIVGYSNWGAEYDRRTKQTTYRFINSESYNIVGIKPAHKVSYILENGTKVELMANTATIEDSNGKRQKVDIIDIKDNPQNLEAATILAKEKSRLFSKAKTLPRREQPAIYREINAIEEFLFVNDNIKEGNRTLQNKTFDFGYAMTVHKSQGSTFTHVLVDDTDIAKARSQSAQTTSPDYDAFSSMVDNPDTVMEETQTADSGFDSASSDMQVTSQGNLFTQMQQSQGLNAQTINNQANETLNIRQQLEYVAVSRATDTVTIISNNVKTEDSPLNYIPKNSTQGNLDITTANRKEMTPQLIQQLQVLLAPLGNKVHGLADMRKYFQENPDILNKVQTLVIGEKGIRSLDIAEEVTTRMDNLSIANEMEKAGKDALTIKMATGWERGADGKWRYEVEDVQITDSTKQQLVNKTILDYHYHDYQEDIDYTREKFTQMLDEGFEPEPWIKKEYIPKTFKITEVIKQDKAFNNLVEAYPNLRNLIIVIDSYKGPGISSYQSKGSYDKLTNTLTINLADPKEFALTLNHELQHIVQDFEGFSYGANMGQFENYPEMVEQKKVRDAAFKKLIKAQQDREAGKLSVEDYFDIFAAFRKEDDKLQSLPYNLYQRVAGEVEARTVETRNRISREQRRNSLFTDDMYKDVAKKDLIFLQEELKNNIAESRTSVIEVKDTAFFLTSDGEIYGFVAPNGDIYLDETKISPEHPIHEYTHLWDRMVAKKNPKLWKRGIQLMKQTSLWKQIENDSNYGKRWKEAGRNSKQIEQLIASEVHARFVGEGGQQLLDNLAKEKGAKGIIGKLKQWILDFWKDLKATFSDFSDDEIQKLTLKDFNHMTMRDFADAVNFAKASSLSEFQGITPEQVKQAKDLKRNKIEFIQNQIDWIEERRKWNKATKEQLNELTKLQQDLAAEQNLYNGLSTGASTITINEHGIPQVTTKDSLNRNSTITQQSAFDVSKAEFYSGAADGADKAWGAEARELGIKVTDYTKDSWNSLSQEWKNKLSAEYEEVAKALARPVIPLGNRGDIEVRRDMMQADKADAIFAIGSVIKPEHKGTRYTNKSNHDVVDGGTGYAVQRGIIRGIPVYVFDQSDNQWKVWNKNSNSFIPTSEPTLTPHATTIGTRGINDAGRQAIRNVLAKTLGQQSTQQQVKGDNSSNQAPVPEASPLEQTSQKISLPSYEYFNDLYEGTEVDAAWKIPVLQDLDSQLSTENTEDENLQILSKMDRVLQSPSQEEYEKAPTPQQEEINNQMKEYFKRNQQLNNLLDNNVGLSPSEIRSTAETIVNTLSDIITEIQQHPEKTTEYWPTLKTDKDLSKLSRKEIVEILSVNRIMELTKQRFENLKFSEDPVVYSLYDSRRLIEQHNLVMNNWEAVIRFAGDIFVANEGFGIKHNSKKGNYEVEEREYQGYDYDDYSSYQDPEATAEETDEQEHWQIEAKTISVINSMTEQIRMAIHNCYELDRNGNKILDKWGIPKRVNKIDTVKKILYWTNGALNLNDMIARMEAQKERNPWVTQLTQRLADKSGKEADFQSQFYTTMHRHFQLYGIGQYEDGHYKHKILNRHKALSDTIKGISTLFQMHQHPLFNRNSTINLESLKALEGWYNELETIRKKYKLMMVFTSGEDARGEYVTSNDLELSNSDIETATKAIVAASKMLGYVTTEEEVLPIINKDSIFRMTKALDYMLNHEGLKAQAKNNTKEYKPFEFKKENNIRGALTKFLQPMMNSLEETALNTIFEDGKMYQSNVIPSFLSQLFDSFAQSDENFKPWAESFYGNSQWFKKDGRWRTPWLATMMENPEARKAFEHHVQLNFNKHNYMRNLSPEEYIISCITNYFFKTTNEKNTDHTEAWFRVPIQSNKPSSEFIKFFSYRGIDYKKQIVSAMQEFFLQELDRIDTIRKRNKQKEDSDYISSWDEHGRHFMFLPFLNSYLIDNKKLVSEEGNDLFHNEDGTVNVQKNNELKSLLNEKLQAEQSMKPEKDMRLLKLVEEATSIYMQNRADQILAKYEKNGILKAAEKVENINDYGRSVRDNLENFLWNDFFAANNILQLTITDKAFYPTTAELQKRLAELHAPGVKANKYATDYGNPEKGIPAKRVSDGIYRTILISDYESFTANIIDNLTEIFNRKIEQASPDEKQAWIALKESLVGENGRYRNINVTDGQAYSSPASYRKKMLMFGKWSQEAEELYQKIRSGNYSLDDIRTVFQPLKPFVYGHLHKKTGVQNAPIQEMNVPFQAKNSEYLLLMADALIQGEKTGRPNILRAIYNIMEESEELFPTKGIDTVQFKSAIKSGAQGIIHLSDFTENPAGEEMARTALREQMYIKDDSGKIVDYNYDTFVQSTDYDNYALQQEVPKHFQEHWQAEPSQKRANIMSDLDMWINPQGDKSDPANVNYYSWKDPDGTEHKLTAQEFRRKYEEVHAQNIEESFDELTKLFKFNSNSRLERNTALSELLQEEIESSPRYGIDLLQACQIDPKTGEFRIPKGDPIQSKRIEQLINSIIKNRVNKQKLAGGPIVQVTNWGTSRQLHIRFNDKNGNLLKTKEEYEQHPQQESYQDYIKKNQAGIAHFEIFAPASWKKHLEKFRNPDGSVNFEAIERCDLNLLKMITSRIPNEDKYSIAHGKIVGFMPEVAGEAIMFPYELTEIDDSDFDVDKRYCHVFEIEDIVEKDWNEISDSLLQKGQELYQQYFHTNIPERNLQGIIDAMVKNPQKFPTPNEFRKDLLTYYMGVRYEVKYPKKGTRADRNNQILNMDWAVLSNEMTASKILNPGGFDIPKHDAYVIAVYKAKNGTVSWETLEDKTTKQLQKMMPADGDLAWFDTQVQFYKQNAAGSTLIGIFAVNKVAHAFLEADDILIDVDDVCGEGSSFNIADKEFTGKIEVDPAQDSNGAYVGKQLGSMVGASADTAKDAWLDLIDINMTTTNVYNTLLRFGMPQKDAALFMSQDVLVTALEEYNRANMEEPVTFDSIISKKIMTIGGKYGYNQDSEINREPLTREELKYGLLHDDNLSDNVRAFKDKIDYKVLLAFSNLQRLASAIRKPTFVTRLNSISSAVGPLIIDNIILEHKLREFLESENLEGTGFYSSDGTHLDMDDLLSNHPMLRAFSKAIDSREPDCPTKILFADMPAGSGKFKGLIEAFPDNIKDNIYKNRQLLSKLSDFYQSYMLVANGIINPAHLGDYIKKFPEYFVAKRIKEKYPDNAFIQAIQPFKKNGRGFLNTETTGMTEQEKERLRMAWTDLHKVNPTLSKQLLTYAFFRRGIGFSPETWTDLLSVYVKEHITSDSKNGSSVSYVDTYRHFPTDNMVESIIMEQFIRNNWNDNRIVPVKGGEGTYYDYSHLDKGILYVHSKKDKDSLQGIQFMRTTVDKKTYLWKRITPMGDTDSSIEFQRIMPLGNNGEYIEMSLDENMTALEEVDELKQNDEQPELPDNAPKDAAVSDDSSAPAPIVSITEQAKSVTDIVKYMITSRNLSEKVAVDYVAELHKKAQDGTISKFSKQDIQRIAKDNGLNLDVDAALEWFKNLC